MHHQPGVHHWFALGVLLGVLSLLVPAMLWSGWPFGFDADEAVMLIIALMVLASVGWRLLPLHRSYRPHTLFTPLYDQRPAHGFRDRRSAIG